MSSFLLMLFTAVAITLSGPAETHAAPVSQTQKVVVATTTALAVPFYSQFTDITAVSWKKVGCGIASLAMLVDYYKPAVSVDTLLAQGIASGAYLQNAGWTYKGLIGVAEKYGLQGASYDLGTSGQQSAFAEFKTHLKDGPVMASIHYKFDPKSTIPHLVVINKIVGDMVYYNDPAADKGDKQISVAGFLGAWKKRFIVLRPTQQVAKVAVAQK